MLGFLQNATTRCHSHYLQHTKRMLLGQNALRCNPIISSNAELVWESL
jgi:hypothetical protein